MNQRPCHSMDIAAFVADELMPDEARRVQQHLEQCESCRSLASELALLRDTLRELEDPPGFEQALHAMRNDVMRRVDAAQADIQQGRFQKLSWSSVSRSLGLAAAAVGLILGWRAWTRRPSRNLAPLATPHLAQNPVLSRSMDIPRASSSQTSPQQSSTATVQKVVPPMAVATKAAPSRRPRQPSRAVEDTQQQLEALVASADPPGSDPAPVFIQQTPQVVIYWVKPVRGGVS
jgi:anti-sigma factor RsiW